MTRELIVVHISDIHLAPGPQADRALARMRKLPGAINRGITKLASEPGAILIAVTGDVSQSGKTEQFKLAEEAFRRLADAVNKETGKRVHIAVSPGNHDCDFTASKSFRENILDSLYEKSSTITTDVVQLSVEPQIYFKSFSNSIHSAENIETISPLLDRITIDVESQEFRINIFNTSWMSRRLEKPGTILMPADVQELLPSEHVSNKVVLSLMHHPISWYHQRTQHLWREYIERCSDLVLTGHEHRSDAYVREQATGKRQSHIEGHVFSSSNPSECGFNILAIDTQSQSSRIARFKIDSDGSFVAAPQVDKFELSGKFSVHSNAVHFTHSFQEELDDPGMELQHPRVARLRLKDFFVPPDLKEIDLYADPSKTERSVISNDHAARLLSVERAIVVGAEFSGKSALARRLCAELREKEKYPVLLSGRDFIYSSDEAADVWIEKSIRKCYGHEPNTVDRFYQIEKSERIALIDDLHAIGSTISQSRFCEIVSRTFSTLIAFSGDAQDASDLLGAESPSSVLWSFRRFRILDLNKKKQWSIVRKWCELGSDYIDDQKTLVSRIHERQKIITSAIHSKLIPSMPSNVMLLLHFVESQSKSQVRVGSSGLLYQAMLTEVLLKTSKIYQLETKLNYLAHVAIEIFGLHRSTLDRAEFSAWHQRYCQQMSMSINEDVIIRELTEAHVLLASDSEVKFRYRYAYCYFVAKYLSDHFSEDETTSQIAGLVERLHLEESGNIILFLCHTPRNESVLRELKAAADLLFEHHSEFDMSDPRRGDVEVTSGKILPATTALENRENLANAPEEDGDDDLSIDEIPPELTSFAASMRIIDIVGQVLRGFVGTFRGNLKAELVSSSFALALRTMSAMQDLVDSRNERHVLDVAKMIKKAREDAHIETSLSDAQQLARIAMNELLRQTCLRMVKHTSSSLASEHLSLVYDGLLNDTLISRSVIDLSVRYDINKGVPIAKTESLIKRLKPSNKFARSIVRDIVWNHLYLYDVKVSDRQRLCAAVDIKMRHVVPHTSPRRLSQ